MLHDCPNPLLPRHDCRHRRGRETRTHDAFSHRARGGHTLLGGIALDSELGDAGLQLLTGFKLAARHCMCLSPQTWDSGWRGPTVSLWVLCSEICLKRGGEYFYAAAKHSLPTELEALAK